MVFINWYDLGAATLPLLMIAAGVFGDWKAEKLQRRSARFGLRLVCVPLVGVGTLFGLLLLLSISSGGESVSSPIYSPSGRMAVRIDDFDYGATGGNSSVEVYWAKGFRQANAFWGPWKAVEPANIHWISDSEMHIEYDAFAPSEEYRCGSIAAVKIVCSPK